jgi:hypothetical protein
MHPRHAETTHISRIKTDYRLISTKSNFIEEYGPFSCIHRHVSCLVFMQKSRMVLIVGAASVTSATLLYEAYAGSQTVNLGDKHSFEFDF